MKKEQIRRAARLIRAELERIVDALEGVGDALEEIVFDDEEEEEEDGDAPDKKKAPFKSVVFTLKIDPSDGPFFAQEPEEPDGFSDMP